jgi:hypothetical protein
MNENICLSGGAEGADLQWGMVAGCAGHQVIHFGFSGHRSRAPSSEIVTLTDEQLSEAEPALQTASKVLKKYYPPKSMFVRNLLRRNYYQIAWSDAFYAVATIKDSIVQGGTGWAWSMFIERHAGKPCWVFCQTTNTWHAWGPDGWLPGEPPMPSGVWTGVGTRELSPEGKSAIRDLLKWQKPTFVS